MAHVIPTLRNTARATYTPPAMRRKTNIPASTGSPATTADFGTVLKDTAGTTKTAATPPGTIGTMTPSSASPVVIPAATTTSPMAPTAQALFGDNPWSSGAGGAGPYGSYGYNPQYFATPQTAAKVAQMLGGKVVAADAITPNGPFKQNQANQMVQMPDGKMINAGLVAGFYDHGYTQQTVDKMIAAEVNGTYMYS